MVGSQDARAVFEVLLKQGDSFVKPACCLVGAAEVVAYGEGVGVVESQGAYAVEQVLLVEGDGFVDPARVVVGVGEVVA